MIKMSRVRASESATYKVRLGCLQFTPWSEALPWTLRECEMLVHWDALLFFNDMLFVLSRFPQTHNPDSTTSSFWQQLFPNSINIIEKPQTFPQRHSSNLQHHTQTGAQLYRQFLLFKC